MTLLDAPSPSPRLQWLAKHDLIARFLPVNSWHGNGPNRYMLCNRAQTRFVFANDPTAEAEIAYCERYGITHHSIDEWSRTSLHIEEDWS